MRKVWFVLVISSLWVEMARAENPVYFPDGRLKAAVEEALWISNPTPTDMLGLTELRSPEFAPSEHSITDIRGLEYALNLQTLDLRLNQIDDLSLLAGLTNLEYLSLSKNQIHDLSPLASLVNLQYVDLHGNEISDISPLSGLIRLQTLILRLNHIGDISALAGLLSLQTLIIWDNRITDISALSGLSNLRTLDLSINQITDISPLTALTSLESLSLLSNPWSEEACYIYLPQIYANNPGIRIQHNYGPFTLSVSSTLGGTVIRPGEGDFTFAHGQVAPLEVRTDPFFRFVDWSGTFATTQNPTSVTMNGDHEIRASFVSVLGVLHVDDDAANDPGPRDSLHSDPQENGTPEHPFDQIQEAIEVAVDGVSILVHPGAYREDLRLLGKNLRLLGADREIASGGPWAILEGRYAGPVVSFRDGEGPGCLLSGFIITRGKGLPATALLCDRASPTVANCLIVGNRASGPNGAAIQCTRSSAAFLNCTIADNYGGPQGAGLVLIDSAIQMTNSILWGNLPDEVLSLGDSGPSIRYCDVRGWWPEVGDLNVDPLFARPGAWVNPKDPNEILVPQDERAIWREGDYHLKSQAGRWDPAVRAWVQDDVSSPCLDRGDPATPVGYEAAPNGGRVNLGAYGGTTEASKSFVSAGSP